MFLVEMRYAIMLSESVLPFHSRKMHLGKFLFLVLNIECFYGS